MFWALKKWEKKAVDRRPKRWFWISYWRVVARHIVLVEADAGIFLQVANEIVGNYCRDYPLNDQPPFLFGLSLVLIKIFLAKAVYMVIGSSYLSAKKILVRGS